MILWQLFVSFLKIGFVSFGGGYAVIPMIQHDSERYGWLTPEHFQQTVSLAGMSPGPIATNSATLIGYQTAGIGGAFAATGGIVLPSLVLVVLIASFFYKINNSPMMKSSFYGLRPIITGLIIYAAIHFGFASGWASLLQPMNWMILLIGGFAFMAIVKYKLHPLLVIAGSAVLGMAFF
ncbi:chromate transporter [Paenibacillus sp. Z6-24]